MSHIAVIPARSGSKGLIDKNIKLLNGKPLMAYTIEAALDSGVFDCVHVSTDSEKYADIARKYGADVPFLRSAELASDSAGSWDVVKAVVDKYKELGQDFDVITLLQPTSPLRDKNDIKNAYARFTDLKADAVVSVCETDHSPLWSNTLAGNGSMDGFLGDANSPRQSLDTYYRINGAIYIVKKDFLFEDTNIYRKGCFSYVMSRQKSIDIDTQHDFDMAAAYIPHHFNITQFINQYVTKRPESMFVRDINDNYDVLSKQIKDKSVLVIGGAGSIGSSFIKAVLPFKPKSLTVVDINENALAELTRDLRSTKDMYVPDEYITYPMDFASEVFEKMFRNHKGFDIVGNFSAHKHVRSEKDIYSVEALLKNNVIHAKKLLDILCGFPPEKYFCVSTDKAANPVNIMGASKRIMEDLIFSYSDKFPVKTARFANVAFSNGSLPAGFLERINKLQPISAPSDVKRYFVSPEESGQICMLSCMLGDNRAIFFPKLKESQMMTFDSIARNLLQSMGYEVYECASAGQAVDMAERLKNESGSGSNGSGQDDANSGRHLYPVFFEKSDTSGEKAYEEFFTDEETVDTDSFISLGVIKDKQICDREKLMTLISELERIFDGSNNDGKSLGDAKDNTAGRAYGNSAPANDEIKKADIVDILSEYLPNFKHIETGKSLDSKM